MACVDCKDKVSQTPQYSEARPPSSAKGCQTCGSGGNLGGGIILPPGEGGGTGNITIVEAGNQMRVDDNSYPGVDSFKVHYAPVTALTLTLSYKAYVGLDLQPAIVTLGKTVTSVELTWIYNKNVAAQALDNDYVPEIIDPDLAISDRTITYTSDIIKKIKFTLTGNDGLGQPGSIAVKSSTVDFANYILWGDYQELVGENTTEVSGLISALKLLTTNEVSNVKNRLVYSSGLTPNDYFYYVYPERLGFSFFTKQGASQGGFIRLKSVSGTLKSELAGGDVEQPIEIINDEGYPENYLIYQSLSGQQGDALKGFNVTS